MVVTELAGTTLVYKKQHILGQALSNYMAHSMHITSVDYGLNISDTQLWDEIQMEVCKLMVLTDFVNTVCVYSIML